MSDKLTPELHKQQIEAYRREAPPYKTFAAALKRVLEEACKPAMPEAIVQTRAKGISSFGEKCVRKFDKYPDAVNQLTDLCGGRVIVQTLSQVEAVRRFVEENFSIVETEDIGLRLGEKEFGYRDRHYIIQLKPERAARIGFTAQEIQDVGGRKAELQIRTWAQHAWADTLHDRTYKTPIKLTAEDHRTSALLAALMEDGDISFDRLSGALDARVANYAAVAPLKKLEEEIGIQKLILENEPDEKNKPGLALRLARLYAPLLKHKEAIALLDEWQKHAGLLQDVIDLELGTALCASSRTRPDSPEYLRGRQLLQDVVQRLEAVDYTSVPDLRKFKSLRARTLSQLGRAWEVDPARSSEARSCYRAAFEAEPENPYHLADMLGFELHCAPQSDLASIQRPNLHQAIRTCEQHAEAGIELPFAFFTMGRLQLLLAEHETALQNYLRGAHHCFDRTNCFGCEVVDAEIAWLHRVQLGRELPAAFQQVRDFLLLTKAASAREECRAQAPTLLPPPRATLKAPVLILAGGAASISQTTLDQLRKPLTEALRNFSGTVISGGTRSGIPGLVGNIAEVLKAEGSKHFHLVGYRPEQLPDDAPKDDRYDESIRVGKAGFTSEQILANWTDILATGIEPKTIRLLGIGGGPVAAVEYRMALALGTSVAVIQTPKGFADPQDAVDTILASPQWNQFKNLLPLPCDDATLRAFLTDPAPSPVESAIEGMAQEFHARYVKDNPKKLPENMRPWAKLPETFKTANLEQAGYAVNILRAAGFEVRPATGAPDAIKSFEGDTFKNDVERMAQLEHGRWNVERLREGWRPGKARNDEKRINPCIVPWTNDQVLTEEIKGYDRNAIRAFPEILAQAGLEVYQP